MKNGHSLCCYAGCLLAGMVGLVRPATAQSDTFGGDPSSNRFIRIPDGNDDWTRHFRLGALLGLNINAKFSQQGNFNISGNNPAAGIFDDGYIKPDQGGHPGYTANFGYNTDSQISGNTLTMHSSSGFSADGSSQTDGSVIPGLEVAYGDNLWYWKHARVGWELGFGWLPIEITDHASYAASVTQSTYQFSTGGVVLPGAPYQGDPNGSGASIPYPSSFNPVSTIVNPSGIVSGSHSLDVSLYTLRLGPSFYWDVADPVGLSIGAGPAVGLVSGDYKYNELVTVNGVSSHNDGQISGTELVYGAYVNLAVMYHLQNNGDIFLGAQFMPMSNATLSGGGRQGQLDLGGQLYFSIGINWPF